jgi:hypothetical protein
MGHTHKILIEDAALLHLKHKLTVEVPSRRATERGSCNNTITRVFYRGVDKVDNAFQASYGPVNIRVG